MFRAIAVDLPLLLNLKLLSLTCKPNTEINIQLTTGVWNSLERSSICLWNYGDVCVAEVENTTIKMDFIVM